GFQSKPLEAVHVLGGSDWWSLFYDRKPWHRSVDRPEIAGGAQSAAIDCSSAVERGGNPVSVRPIPDGWSNAVRVLSSAVSQFRQARQNLSTVHREPHAARDLGTADCGDSRRRYVEPKRSVELALVQLDFGFLLKVQAANR